MTARAAKRNSSAAENAVGMAEEYADSAAAAAAATSGSASASISPPMFDPAGDGNGLGPPRKRKRRVVSCAECHRRKQKCDRNQPCRACIDRKMESSCHYETTAMSHERHHMRVIEAATYSRSLQEGGSLPVKAAGFGYAHTSDNTLGFLRKIDDGDRLRMHGRGGSGSGSGSGSNSNSNSNSIDSGIDGLEGLSSLGSIGGIGSIGEPGHLDGLDRLGSHGGLSGLIKDSGNGIIITTTAAEAAALAEQQYLQSQQPQTRQQQQQQQQQEQNQQHQQHQQHHQQSHSHSHSHHHSSNGQAGDPYGVTDRYRSLIRELPPRQYIDRLVEVYFHDFNWHYYALEQDIFLKRLADWTDVAMGPFGSLQPPHQLSPDLRAFPALLFQVLAIGLLVLPDGDPEGSFDAIKRPSNATLEGLAMDYSEAGNGILALLGKRQMSLTTVMAAFLRAAFLKYVALITEAWHAIGSAIRDAQEIGLHRTSLDPKPWDHTAEAVLENEWEIQSRRRMWMTLVSWDVHMGVVLGRPTTVDLSDSPVLPVDCILPATLEERAAMPVQVRGENDPPTPLTRAIWGFQAIEPLRAILELAKEGPVPRDFAAVDALHDELVQLQASTPPYFRLENPDTRFDGLAECHWLPAARVAAPQVTIFNLIALHRHYIFSRARSRTEGLHACLDMLQIQRVHFALLRPQQYRMFSLFFGTFDSLVLMASIYILFPKEHPELVPAAIQHFRWSVERFELMSDHFSLARSALGVLQALYLRLRKTLGIHFLEGSGGSGGGGGDGGIGGGVGGGSSSSAPIDLLTLSNIDPSLKDEGTLLGGGGVAVTDPVKKCNGLDGHETTTGNIGGIGGINGESVIAGSLPSSSSSSSHNGLTPGTFSSISGPSSAVSVATDAFGAVMVEGGAGGRGGGVAASTTPMIPTTLMTAAASAPEPLLDPALQDADTSQQQQQQQQTLDGTLPEFGDVQETTGLEAIFPNGFDWTSFQPICPTGDLTYNILMGVSDGSATMPTWGVPVSSVGAGESVGLASTSAVSEETMAVNGNSCGDGGGGGDNSDNDDSGGNSGNGSNGSNGESNGLDVDAALTTASTSIDGTAVPWQFEGDFASNSIWGLLNIYTPF